MKNKQILVSILALLLFLVLAVFFTKKLQQLSAAKKYLNHLLIEAINQNQTEKMQELIEAGADINIVPGHRHEGKISKTALMSAVENGNNNLVDWLINHKANLNIETDWEQPHAGKPALSFALEAKNLDAGKLLVDAGANVNLYNDLGTVENLEIIPESLRARNPTLLIYAIGRKLPMPFITMLLSSTRVEVNKPAFLKTITPLMITAAIGYEEAVKALLDAGADKEIINTLDNKKAIDYARDAGYKNIVKLLI
jgi:ankyrin repeat protein